jgi:hypothetical protein
MLFADPLTGPDHGDLTITDDGSYTYSPDLNFNGLDAFSYIVCDNGSAQLCDTADVTITVVPVNDPPTALDDGIGTPEDTPVSGNVLGNDSDIDGDMLVVEVPPLSDVENGILELNADGNYLYQPSMGFNGLDSFTYVVCDNGTPKLCDSAVVIILVDSINDPPVASDDSNNTLEDTPTTGNLLSNDIDPDGGALLVNTIPVLEPMHGTLVLLQNGDYTYSPFQNYYGDDLFKYEVCDTGVPVICDTATVSITISPVNDAPLAENDIIELMEDGSAAGNLLLNDIDPEIDPLTLNSAPVELPSNGIVLLENDGSYSYTPNSNFFGQDMFRYAVCDLSSVEPFILCDTATVMLSVMPVNDAPVAMDDTFTTDEDLSLNGNVILNDTDIDGDALEVLITPEELPVNGTLTLNGNGTYSYMPEANYFGDDQFSYVVCDITSVDPTPLCDTATVSIQIVPVNDAPVAVNDTFQTEKNTLVEGNLLSNDLDPDGDPVIISSMPISGVSNGTLQLNEDGSFSYEPDVDFSGADGFSYVVCDMTDIQPFPLCDTAQVVLLVDSVSTGILESDKQSVFQLFPNPAGETLSIKTPLTMNPYFEFFNGLGKPVQVQHMGEYTGTWQFDVSTLPQGFYFVMISGYSFGKERVSKIFLKL